MRLKSQGRFILFYVYTCVCVCVYTYTIYAYIFSFYLYVYYNSECRFFVPHTVAKCNQKTLSRSIPRTSPVFVCTRGIPDSGRFLAARKSIMYHRKSIYFLKYLLCPRVRNVVVYIILLFAHAYVYPRTVKKIARRIC